MVDVWLEVESHQFNPLISYIVLETLYATTFLGTVPDEKVVAEAADKLDKVLDVYEARLAEAKYLAGDFYSLADLHHISFIHYLMTSPYKTLVESRPHVMAWWDDISSRPASAKVRAAMAYIK